MTFSIPVVAEIFLIIVLARGARFCWMTRQAHKAIRSDLAAKHMRLVSMRRESVWRYYGSIWKALRSLVLDYDVTAEAHGQNIRLNYSVEFVPVVGMLHRLHVADQM